MRVFQSGYSSTPVAPLMAPTGAPTGAPFFRARRPQRRPPGPCSLRPALLEAAGEKVYLDGLGELLGPAGLEQAGAQSFGVGGGAPRRQPHSVCRREVPVQEPGEETREVGVAAPDGREGLDLRRPG